MSEPYVAAEAELVEGHANDPHSYRKDIPRYARRLAARRGIAKLQADALRQAARDMETGNSMPLAVGNPARHLIKAYVSSLAWSLRARADQIEREVQA